MSTAVNKILKLLDPKEREIVFWNYYKKSEHLDYITPKQAFYGWFRRIFLTYSSNYENSPEKRLEEAFWLHFLHRSTSFIIFIHALNILLLLLMIVAIIFIMLYTDKYIERHNLSNISYASLLPDVLYWLFISSICMYFLVIFSKDENMTFTNSILPQNRYKAWMITGNFIVLSRFLLLVYMFILSSILHKATNNFDYSSCQVPERLSADDRTIAIPFMRILLDTGQVVLFSTVPFPHPFSFLFMITEISVQCLRIGGCSDRIPSSFASFRTFFTITIVFIYFYVMLSSLSIQRGSKNNYSMLVALTELSSDKFQFIKSLCEEVKVPLEFINDSIEYIKSEIFLGNDTIQSQEEVIAIQLQVYTINLLTDNILFLSKMYEGRFEFKSELVNVMHLLQKSMKPILTTSDISTYIECKYKLPKHNIHYSAQLILIYIRNIVFIVAFAIENIKLRNKISHISTSGTNKSMSENKIIITLKSVKNSTDLDSTVSTDDVSSKNSTNTSNVKQECVLQNKNTKYHFELLVKFPVSLDSFTNCSTLNSGGRELDSNGFGMMKSLNKLLCAIHGNGYHETKNALTFSFPNYSNDKILNTVANNSETNITLNPDNVIPDGNDSFEHEFYYCCAFVIDCTDNIPVALLRGLQSMKVKVFSIICDDTKHLTRIEYAKIFKQCEIVMIQQFEYYDFIKNHLQYKGKIIYYGIMDVLTHTVNMTFDHTVFHPIDSVQIGLLDAYISQNMKSKSQTPNEANYDSHYFGQNKKKTIHCYMNNIMTKCVHLFKNLARMSKSSDHFQDENINSVNIFAPYSFSEHKVFGVHLFTDEIERSYLKWNIINTTGSILHRASTIDFSFLLMMIYHYLGVAGHILFGGEPLYPKIKSAGTLLLLFWSVFIYCVIILRKYIIYNHLEPNNSSISLFWKLTINWLYVSNSVTLGLAILDLSPRSRERGSHFNYSGEINDPMSVEKMFQSRIGSFTGITASCNLLVSIAFTINLWAFKFCWPHSIIYLITLASKWVIFSAIYLYRALPTKYFILYMVVFLPFYVTNFCVSYHFEESQRTEFVRCRGAIFDYIFMENIMDIFQTNAKSPVNALNLSRRNFFESVKNKILTMKWMKLSLNNVHNIFDTFNISIYNLETLHHKLNFQYNLISSFNTGGKRSATVGIDDTNTSGPFESFTTSLVIDSLIPLLSSMHREITCGEIKVFTHVDVGLSLIKLNKRLFIMVLINAFNVAILNIKRRLHADRYSPKVVQELIIIVRENLKKPTSNFNDFRPLEIEVADTGISSDFRLHSKFGQQMLSCDNVNNSYNFFERITATNERLNVQLITIHYKYILNITEKVSSIIPKKRQYLQAMDYHSFRRYLFDAYDTFVTANISNQYNSSGKNKGSSALVPADNKGNATTTLKSNIRTMVLFQQLGEYAEDSNTIGVSAETNSVQLAFERNGWVVKVVSSFSLFYPESEWLAIADCILIQYDEHNDYYSPNRNDSLVSYAAQLRLMGYKLAIVGLLPLKKEKARVHHKKDNIAFLDSLDHIIVRPILQSTIDEVNLKCDIRIIDSLLGLNLYLSND